MPKTVVGTEIASMKVFDSKLESGAKQAVQAAIAAVYRKSTRHQLGTPKEGGHFIQLTPTAVLDPARRVVVGTCKWEVAVIENGQRKLFASLRQTKVALSTVDRINPVKVRQQSVNDAIVGAVEKELAGVLASLPRKENET
ncbi:MAG TPA: hypothetical protein VK843_16700 [Planctomycetota bacterium]|nr:hypothetical protein [Planctomycetota bacterium]